MTLGYHFLFSNWISSDGADDNNSHLGDPGKPNLISRFRGPTLGVHLTDPDDTFDNWIPEEWLEFAK